MTMFADRADAGRRLAARLAHLGGEDLVVLGLPRGGVPVAHQVAVALGAPLDVIVVRKLGVPFQPEVAMGAIGEGGVRVVDRALMARAGVSDAALRAVEVRERAVLESRVAALRHGRAPDSLRDRVAVIVDDGIATGSTARAACQVARHLGAKKVVVAVPVAPADVSADLLAADELVCCAMPPAFRAVGEYYRDFSSTTDDEVAALLEHDAAVRAGPGQVRRPSIDADVEIELGQRIVLPGRLTVPADSGGLVVFAHGSGSTRSSPRNRRVAAELQSAGLGTLLLDLLTPDEADDRGNVFDIALLGSRVSGVARWVLERPGLASVRLGLFGASTGAAAALWAAADPGSSVAAVVSRGGRPDLAADRLPWVVAPTLLIVGGDDTEVLDLNRQAQSRLRCPNRLVVVPGATHLFEEPGTLDQVARLARAWFGVHLLGVEGPPARSETP